MTSRRHAPNGYKPPRPTRNRGELMQAVFEFIIEFKQREDQEGNSPPLRVIASALDVSHAAVYQAVYRLSRKGLLRYNDQHKLVAGGKYYPPGKIPPEKA